MELPLQRLTTPAAMNENLRNGGGHRYSFRYDMPPMNFRDSSGRYYSGINPLRDHLPFRYPVTDVLAVPDAAMVPLFFPGQLAFVEGTRRRLGKLHYAVAVRLFGQTKIRTVHRRIGGDIRLWGFSEGNRWGEPGAVELEYVAGFRTPERLEEGWLHPDLQVLGVVRVESGLAYAIQEAQRSPERWATMERTYRATYGDTGPFGYEPMPALFAGSAN